METLLLVINIVLAVILVLLVLLQKSEDLKKSIAFIKRKFVKKSPKILYGGSVNSKNIDKLKIITGIDGFLVGGASQDSKKFIDIIKKTIN